jgi:GNAT superfamily N-acetyltransferase
VLVPSGGLTVAEIEDRIVGMMSISQENGIVWIDHLYLHPSAVGHGIGTKFLERVKTGVGNPIKLYTFQENTGARRFYERHGFSPIAFGDGTDNGERCPDVLYEWRVEPTLYDR